MDSISTHLHGSEQRKSSLLDILSSQEEVNKLLERDQQRLQNIANSTTSSFISAFPQSLHDAPQLDPATPYVRATNSSTSPVTAAPPVHTLSAQLSQYEAMISDLKAQLATVPSATRAASPSVFTPLPPPLPLTLIPSATTSAPISTNGNANPEQPHTSADFTHATRRLSVPPLSISVLQSGSNDKDVVVVPHANTPRARAQSANRGLTAVVETRNGAITPAGASVGTMPTLLSIPPRATTTTPSLASPPALRSLTHAPNAALGIHTTYASSAPVFSAALAADQSISVAHDPRQAPPPQPSELPASCLRSLEQQYTESALQQERRHRQEALDRDARHHAAQLQTQAERDRFADELHQEQRRARVLREEQEVQLIQLRGELSREQARRAQAEDELVAVTRREREQHDAEAVLEEQRQQEKEQREKELISLRIFSEHCKRDLARAQEELRAATEQCADTHQALMSAQQAVSQLEERSARSEEQLGDLQRQLSQSKSQYDQLMLRYEQAASRCATLQDDHARALCEQAKVAELECRNAALVEERDTETRRVRALEQEMRALRQAHTEELQRNEEAAQERENAHALEVGRLRRAHADALGEAEHRYDSLLGKHNAVTQDLEELRAENAELTQENDALKEKFRLVRKEREEWRVQAVAVEEEVVALRGKCERQSASLATTSASLLDAQTQLSQAHAHTATLRRLAEASLTQLAAETRARAQLQSHVLALGHAYARLWEQAVHALQLLHGDCAGVHASLRSLGKEMVAVARQECLERGIDTGAMPVFPDGKNISSLFPLQDSEGRKSSSPSPLMQAVQAAVRALVHTALHPTEASPLPVPLRWESLRTPADALDVDALEEQAVADATRAFGSVHAKIGVAEEAMGDVLKALEGTTDALAQSPAGLAQVFALLRAVCERGAHLECALAQAVATANAKEEQVYVLRGVCALLYNRHAALRHAMCGVRRAVRVVRARAVAAVEGVELAVERAGQLCEFACEQQDVSVVLDPGTQHEHPHADDDGEDEDEDQSSPPSPSASAPPPALALASIPPPQLVALTVNGKLITQPAATARDGDFVDAFYGLKHDSDAANVRSGAGDNAETDAELWQLLHDVGVVAAGATSSRCDAQTRQSVGPSKLAASGYTHNPNYSHAPASTHETRETGVGSINVGASAGWALGEVCDASVDYSEDDSELNEDAHMLADMSVPVRADTPSSPLLPPLPAPTFTVSPPSTYSAPVSHAALPHAVTNVSSVSGSGSTSAAPLRAAVSRFLHRYPHGDARWLEMGRDLVRVLIGAPDTSTGPTSAPASTAGAPVTQDPVTRECSVTEALRYAAARAHYSASLSASSMVRWSDERVAVDATVIDLERALQRATEEKEEQVAATAAQRVRWEQEVSEREVVEGILREREAHSSKLQELCNVLEEALEGAKKQCAEERSKCETAATQLEAAEARVAAQREELVRAEESQRQQRELCTTLQAGREEARAQLAEVQQRLSAVAEEREQLARDKVVNAQTHASLLREKEALEARETTLQQQLADQQQARDDAQAKARMLLARLQTAVQRETHSRARALKLQCVLRCLYAWLQRERLRSADLLQQKIFLARHGAAAHSPVHSSSQAVLPLLCTLVDAARSHAAQVHTQRCALAVADAEEEEWVSRSLTLTQDALTDGGDHRTQPPRADADGVDDGAGGVGVGDGDDDGGRDRPWGEQEEAKEEEENAAAEAQLSRLRPLVMARALVDADAEAPAATLYANDDVADDTDMSRHSTTTASTTSASVTQRPPRRANVFKAHEVSVPPYTHAHAPGDALPEPSSKTNLSFAALFDAAVPSHVPPRATATTHPNAAAGSPALSAFAAALTGLSRRAAKPSLRAAAITIIASNRFQQHERYGHEARVAVCVPDSIARASGLANAAPTSLRVVSAALQATMETYQRCHDELVRAAEYRALSLASLDNHLGAHTSAADYEALLRRALGSHAGEVVDAGAGGPLQGHPEEKMDEECDASVREFTDALVLPLLPASSCAGTRAVPLTRARGAEAAALDEPYKHQLLSQLGTHYLAKRDALEKKVSSQNPTIDSSFLNALARHALAQRADSASNTPSASHYTYQRMLKMRRLRDAAIAAAQPMSEDSLSTDTTSQHSTMAAPTLALPPVTALVTALVDAACTPSTTTITTLATAAASHLQQLQRHAARANTALYTLAHARNRQVSLLRDHYLQLFATATTLHARLRRTQRHCAQLRRRQEELSRALAAARDDYARAREENEHLRSTCKRLHATVVETGAELEEERVRNSQLFERTGELQQESLQCVQERNRLDIELQSLQQQHAQMQGKLEDMGARYSESVASGIALQQEINTLQQTLADKSGEVVSLQGKLDSVRDRLSLLERTCTEYSDNNNVLIGENEEFSLQLRDLQLDIAQLRRTNVAQELQLQAKEQEVLHLTQQLVTLSRASRTHQEQLNNTRHALSLLSTRVRTEGERVRSDTDLSASGYGADDADRGSMSDNSNVRVPTTTASVHHARMPHKKPATSVRTAHPPPAEVPAPLSSILCPSPLAVHAANTSCRRAGENRTRVSEDNHSYTAQRQAALAPSVSARHTSTSSSHVSDQSSALSGALPTATFSPSPSLHTERDNSVRPLERGGRSDTPNRPLPWLESALEQAQDTQEWLKKLRI